MNIRTAKKYCIKKGELTISAWYTIVSNEENDNIFAPEIMSFNLNVGWQICQLFLESPEIKSKCSFVALGSLVSQI